MYLEKARLFRVIEFSIFNVSTACTECHHGLLYSYL